jgi:hypothetical protein
LFVKWKFLVVNRRPGNFFLFYREMSFKPDCEKIIPTLRREKFDLQFRVHLLEERLAPGSRPTDDAWPYPERPAGERAWGHIRTAIIKVLDNIPICYV